LSQKGGDLDGGPREKKGQQRQNATKWKKKCR